MIIEQRQEGDVQEFFSRFAATWDTLYGGKRNAFWRWFDNRYRRAIYERYQLTFDALGDDLSGKSILDIGCGNAVYCFEAARRNADLVVGVDVAQGMIDMCMRRSRELGMENRTRFVQSAYPPNAPIDELARTFDYSIIMGVMDYVVDPIPFLTAVRQHTTGFSMLAFPGNVWIRRQLRDWRYRLLRRCEVMHYTDEDVREVCQAAGFARLEIQYLTHSGGCHIVKAYS